MRSYYKYFVNFSNFAIQLGSDVNIRLMITEAYLEPSGRVVMGFFAKIVKAVNYYCKKSSIVDLPLGSNYATLLGYCQTILSFRNIENAARMTLYFASGKLFFFLKNVYSDTELHFSRKNG